MVEFKRWNDGSISANWAVSMLPLVVRQARCETTVTYLDMSVELGMSHHRTVQKAAGRIAEALIELGDTRGWRRRRPPPIQSLIVNKATGLPGHGVDGFMSKQYRMAETSRQRATLLKVIYADLSTYPHWTEVMTVLGADPSAATLDDLTEAASKAGRGGGEGPEHKALKEIVLADPRLVGLPLLGTIGEPEQLLPSGDRVDIMFTSGGVDVAVEVKPATSADMDVARGVYQCVKYRAVMEAASRVSPGQRDVRVALALGGPLPGDLKRLVNAFDIPVHEGLGRPSV